MADSSSSLSEEESDADSMIQLSSPSSWLRADETEAMSLSLSSEKTLFSSSTLYE